MRHKQNNQPALAGWALHAAGCVLILLVVSASYGFGFTQFSQKHEDNRTRTDQLHSLLHTAPEVHKKHRAQQDELEQLTQLTSTMRGRLPNTIQKEEFNNAVKQIAESVDLILENSRWSTPQVTPIHSRSEITLSGTGSFASICKFLNEISQLARITKVSKLEVHSAEESALYPFQITFVLVYGVESHDKVERGESL